jgi:hypothetical protein
LSRLTRRRVTHSTARISRRSRMGWIAGPSDISECAAGSADSGREVPTGSAPETEVLIESWTVLAEGRSARYTSVSLLPRHGGRWLRLSAPDRRLPVQRACLSRLSLACGLSATSNGPTPRRGPGTTISTLTSSTHPGPIVEGLWRAVGPSQRLPRRNSGNPQVCSVY